MVFQVNEREKIGEGRGRGEGTNTNGRGILKGKRVRKNKISNTYRYVDPGLALRL